MSRVFVRGCGAVSPGGWGVAALREALDCGEPLPAMDLARPGWNRPLRVRSVPAPAARLAFMTHARLRRTSPIAHYAVSAGLEALGADAAGCADPNFRLGIIYCAMSGCVNYSRRFYDEVLKDPITASPLVFPETVYNSPASHLAAMLGTTAINYTLVGDPGTFLQALALAADWLIARRVNGCLVLGAEEMDWLNADATRVFRRNIIIGAGSGAVYLGLEQASSPAIELSAVTDSQLFLPDRPRARAVELARTQLPGTHDGELLCDCAVGVPLADRDEQAAWTDWTGGRISPRKILGEGYMAGTGWQCVAAIDAIAQNRCRAANVSVVGTNQQAIAARFTKI